MPRLEEEFFRPVVTILTVRRVAMGLTQEELAWRIGCADRHLAKWEIGKHRPSLYFLLKWCEQLGYRLALRHAEHEDGSA
jgi:transcriptional regulator with XRE-family HTH domain